MTIEFPSPEPFSSTVTTIEQLGADVLGTTSVMTLASGSEYTFGFLHDLDDAPEDVEAAAASEFRALIDDVTQHSQQRVSLPSSPLDPYIYTVQTRIQDLLYLSESTLWLVREEVLDQLDLSTVNAFVPVSSTLADLSAAFDDAVMTVDDNNVVDEAEDTAGCREPWWPYDGTIKTNKATTAAHRYTIHDMIWSGYGLSALQDCHGEEGVYEAESVYDNYDGEHYLGEVTSWGTSMPGSYLDIQGPRRSNNELIYAVGTEAKNNKANTWYYTIIRTEWGNTSSDRGKASGQRANNNCPHPGAPSSWCVFSSDTRHMIPAWEHSVPGEDSW